MVAGLIYVHVHFRAKVHVCSEWNSPGMQAAVFAGLLELPADQMSRAQRLAVEKGLLPVRTIAVPEPLSRSSMTICHP